MQKEWPIYILLDSTEAMLDKSIDTAINCIIDLKHELRRDPYALEAVKISILSVNEISEQLISLTPISEEFRLKFNISGQCCNLNNAFTAILSSEEEYLRNKRSIFLYLTHSALNSIQREIINKFVNSIHNTDFYVCPMNGFEDSERFNVHDEGDLIIIKKQDVGRIFHWSIVNLEESCSYFSNKILKY